MSSKLDEKTEKTLLDAFERLRADERAKKEKQSRKTWRKIDFPISLADSLNRLTKSELDEIRKQLDIKNASNLKKADLIQLLAESIPVKLHDLLHVLDKDRFDLLTNLVENQGEIPATDIDEKLINYYLKWGIVFPGSDGEEKVLVMPNEIIEKFTQIDASELQSFVKRNTEWIKLTKGALYYYGTLNQGQLIDILENYIDEPITRAEYLSIMEQAVPYHEEIRLDSHGFSNGRVFDSNQVVREHQNRKDLKFYPFTKSQLLNAGEVNFVDRNDSYQKFVSFLLEHFDVSKADADQIVEECVYATRIGEEPKHILEFLESRLEINSIHTLRAIMEQVIDLMNNTRQWVLKGYTPVELRPKENKPKANNVIDFKAVKKVGRNEPCPCGSGSKYKKCCGK